jgi:type IV secretory pathway VirB2 component (pilin)
MSNKTKIFTVLILLIISNYSLGETGCQQHLENCNIDLLGRMDKLIELLTTWFNRVAVIALIVLGFMWLKGKINPVHPISMFITIMVVNGAPDIVAWLVN